MGSEREKRPERDLTCASGNEYAKRTHGLAMAGEIEWAGLDRARAPDRGLAVFLFFNWSREGRWADNK